METVMSDGKEQATAAGIEALIARLRQEGVDEGRAEAERIVDEAERRARVLVEKAEAAAASVRKAASEEADRLRMGGEQALKVAMRDTVLELKQILTVQFADQVRGAVSTTAGDEDLLKKMILAVASRARDESALDTAAALEIVLPRSAVGLEDLRRNPEDLREGSLSHFAAAAASEMLRKGVTFTRSRDESEGIRVVLSDDGVTLDLTDHAIAEVILRHLQPRFRALLEGVVG
jgi:V/A-type H+-transporting ATPase subunit E